MKPKEFDDLVRQKFDQNDFAYNPAHWDQVAEKLGGNEKKRRIMMWWWAPVVGMAASVALAFGVSTVLRMGVPASQLNATAHHTGSHSQQHNAEPGAATAYTPEIAQMETPADDNSTTPAKNIPAAQQRSRKHKAVSNNRVAVNKSNNEDAADDGFGIRLKNTPGNTVVLNARLMKLKKNVVNEEDEKKEQQLAVKEPFGTFMQDEEPQMKKVRKVSIILSGGYNRGAQNSGYMAGATIRKMINDKVYVEGLVGFASSNNTQSTSYMEKEVIPGGALATSKVQNTARTSKDVNKNAIEPATRDVIKQKDVSYDLYYAQVTPSIGYNVMKRMSIGIGPDFQRMLVDNRPAPSTVERGTIQVAPVFDIGLVGKTEVSVTKKLRAGVYYRKGVNNVITPMGKYIDRDYLQFQLKYTILNK